MSRNQATPLDAAPPGFDEPEPQNLLQSTPARAPDASIPLQKRAELHLQRSLAGLPLYPTFEAAAVSQERPHRLADGMRNMCSRFESGTPRRNLRANLLMPYR